MFTARHQRSHLALHLKITKAEPGAAPSLKWEARCLVQLLGKNGHTIDKLRELIRVTPKEEAILRASSLHSPALVERIEQALRYRVEVAQEFERLIRALPKNPSG
jgi:hypothetical protein